MKIFDRGRIEILVILGDGSGSGLLLLLPVGQLAQVRLARQLPLHSHVRLPREWGHPPQENHSKTPCLELRFTLNAL